MRGNVARLADVAEWRAVIEGEIDPVIEDPAYLAFAAETLPEGVWDRDDLDRVDRGLESANRSQGKGPLSSACGLR